MPTAVNRTDRLTGILIRLQGRAQTAGQLADRFEVSQRTILRDIDALSQIGVPIIATPGRNGGYQIAEGFWLPPLHLTPQEATVLLLALDHLGDETSSPLGAPHRTVLEKLRSTLQPATRTAVDAGLRSMRVQRDTIPPSASMLSDMRAFVERHHWVEIIYAGIDGSSVRTILPRLVYVASGRWYTRAIDARRAAMRHFRVDRIESARSVPAPPDADRIIRQATTDTRAYSDEAHPQVRACLTPRGRVLALDHPDLRDAVVQGQESAWLVFRCPPEELPYYGRELIRLGPDVRIDAPPELRRWISGYLGNLLLHHEVGSGT